MKTGVAGRSRWMRRALWMPLFGVLLLAGQARAQAPNAEQAFVQGRARFDAHDYKAALPLFRQAVGSSGSPNARIYLARCLRELGQLVESYDEMSRTVADARDLATKEDRYAQTRDAAATELAVLEGRVAKVVVALDASLAGATVELNGAPLAPDHVGVPTAVLPGSVRVVAARGSQRVEQSTTIAAGKLSTVTLSARPEVAAAPTPAPIAPAPLEPVPDARGGFGAVRGVGIGVAAVGVGGFVTFVVGNSIASSKLSTLKSSCGAGPCTDPAFAKVVDAGKSAETVGWIGLGVGIAGAAVGCAMIVFGGGKTATVSAGPAGAALRVSF